METQSTTGKVTATRRQATGKGIARKLRNQGFVPGVCYGLKNECISISLDPAELRKSLDPGRRTNTLLELTLKDGEAAEQFLVMVKDYQIDPLKRNVLHVDLVRVAPDQMMDVNIPLILTGKPEGVKLGGNFHQVFRTLPVRCLPTKIPVSITADVTHLQLYDTLSIKDLLALEPGVEIKLPPNQTLALVMAAKKTETKAAEGVEGEEAAAPTEDEKPAAAADAKAKPAAGK
jgi:large subunit ribosomal protein L25